MPPTKVSHSASVNMCGALSGSFESRGHDPLIEGVGLDAVRLSGTRDQRLRPSQACGVRTPHRPHLSLTKRLKSPVLLADCAVSRSGRGSRLAFSGCRPAHRAPVWGCEHCRLWKVLP